ncbi:MAG: sulfatase-like hydrolase/transferase [Saprospiraceae bacterium]
MFALKKILSFYLVHLTYWLIVGFWARALFLLFYYKEFQGSSWSTLFNCFRYGFRLDLSTACYLLSLSFIFWILFYLSARKILFNIYRWVQLIGLSAYLMVTIADIGVYKHWNNKINLTAIQFADHPKEVWASIGPGDHPIWWLIAFLISMIFFGWCFYQIQKRYSQSSTKTLKEIMYASLISVFCLGMTIIGIRGGLQLEPINQSTAYFSERHIENQASINATWNLMNKIAMNRGTNNPYHFGTASEVKEALLSFYSVDSSHTALSSIAKPNIVFIILEGFTADVIEAFGGETGLTPTIDSLVHTGLIWTNFYANGDRTYKGLPAILNGHPTRPVGSITQDPDQTLQLPSIAKILKSLDYHSSFYYGGESEFANIKSYLINTGYDRIIDIKDFPPSYRGIKWGVPDHYVFDKLSKDLNTSGQPFFACILTLSSHEPYDIPIASLIKSNSLPDLFRNTVYYTDQSLGKFIQQSKNQPWYDSTIFVLTADHGNSMPKEYNNNFDPGKFKIPLIIFGTPLLKQWKGKTNPKLASQTDLTATLLNSLFFRNKDFDFSMNMLDTNDVGKAFYTFDHGFGILQDKTRLAYDLSGNKIVFQQGPVNDSLIQVGKLLMQGTYGPFQPSPVSANSVEKH